MKESKSISRRQFVKSAAVLGAGAATTGALTGFTGAQQGSVPEKWDREADVVVVGYGGAGAATAITAHDEGAEVLVLEKMAEGGGNTAVSGGGFLCPTNVKDSITYIEGLFKFSDSEMDADLVRVYSEEAVKNVDWIKSLREGTEVKIYGHAGFPEVEGSECMDKYHVLWPDGVDGGPQSLWDLLSYAVEEDRGIEVLYETPAKRLVANCDGEVVGVIAESAGKEIKIKARRGVVLTCGGHENDPSLLKNHAMGWPIHFLGNPGNTGDGTRMAQKLGAGTWHMNGLSCPLGLKVDEFEAAFMLSFAGPSYIYVDKRGKRFVNERGVETHAWVLAVNFFDDERLDYPRIPCYAIFDEKTRQARQLWGGIGYNRGKYTWSPDNSKEIEKGWIVKADTIEELAEKVGLDPDALQETVTRWNEDMAAGADSEFHRLIEPPEEDRPAYIGEEVPVWSAPLETPPFYAVTLHPALLNTQGGPRRNTEAQIVDPYGEPIKRLYSAGELGCMWGIIYQGAGNIGECFTFGRIAGKNAAAEKPLA